MKLYIDYDRFEEQFEVVTEENKTSTTSELECNKKELQEYLKANPEEAQKRKEKQKRIKKTLKILGKVLDKGKKENKSLMERTGVLLKIVEITNYDDENILKELKKYLKEKQKEEKQ